MMRGKRTNVLRCSKNQFLMSNAVEKYQDTLPQHPHGYYIGQALIYTKKGEK
jgi:hypothetical protein